MPVALRCVLVAILVAAPIVAQQVGSNVNVLPVYVDPDDPVAFLKGDLYLQRQVEPTVAVSTRNPDHLIAFFNDYRAVDVPDDSGIGGVYNSAVAVTSLLLRPFFGTAVPPIVLPEPMPVAAAEAWVGMSRSYDGGLTWSGGFLPGAPFDGSPASLAAPIRGLQAATDPVAMAGPCGRVYLAFIGFTRGGESAMTVARYRDRDDVEGGDTWSYEGMTILETGNNASNGYFLDKPDLAVDVLRPAGSDPCGHAVMASYTTFNGLTRDGKFQSKVNFARSVDGGLTWDLQKLNQPYNQNQGTAITVDPRPGTPTTTGGGTVHLVWRHFFDPDLVLAITSTDFGRKFSKPVALTGATPMAPFDQPTLATDAVPDPVTDVTFRSNGFPTAVVSGDGTVHVAWQERVDVDPSSPGFGRPAASGSPRIVLTRSADGGRTWSARRAADLGDRDVPSDPGLPAPGSGTLPRTRGSGPQVMPELSSGGGRLLLAYYESRGLAGVDPASGAETILPADVSPISGYISGIDRVLDLRAALLDPATGAVLSSRQVSRYPISSSAALADGEDLGDVAPVNPPCSPDHGPGLAPCVRQVSFPNLPHSGAGTSPFIGDYVTAVPLVPFVPDGGSWRWATEPGDVPAPGFHVVFTDNRHVVRPTEPAEWPEWARYPLYGPPGIGGWCQNPGSRNSDVLTARVDAGLVLRAPTAYKQLDTRRSFPFSLTNTTDATRFYRLTLSAGADAATFSLDPAVDVDQGEVAVFAHSSVSQLVYVEAGADGPIRVEVVEIGALGGDPVPGGQTGAVSFNLDPGHPPVAGLGADESARAFVVNAFVVNAFVVNAFVVNQGAASLSPTNAFVVNPSAENAFVVNSTIHDVVDTTWQVSNGGGSTASSFLPVVNIDNAAGFLGDYAFQLLVYRASTEGVLDGCASYDLEHAQILSNVAQDPADVDNAFVVNAFVVNPYVDNAFVANAFVVNSTFTVAPSDAAGGPAGKLLALDDDDGTLKAPRSPDTVYVTLRAFQLAEDPELVFDPTKDPPSLAIVPLSCDTRDPGADCVTYTAPDLVPSADGFGPLAVRAGGSLTVPAGAWEVLNQGNVPATAENRELRHGFYLSADETVSLASDGSPAGGDVLLAGVASTQASLAAGGVESFGEVTLDVPASFPAGERFLVLLADDLREVSEVNEVNNAVAIPITIEPPNAPPVASGLAFATAEDTPYSGVLPATDPDGDGLTFTIVEPPVVGTVVLDDPATGAFTYVPAPESSGFDVFTFQVSDGIASSTAATVSVTVTAVNDPPVAVDDAVTVQENTGPTPVDVLANDSDVEGAPLTVVEVGPAAHGTTAVGPPVTYAPAANFTGTDAFVYRISDGGASAAATVHVTVVDAVPDWGFLGLLDPWTEDPLFTGNLGRSVPLLWRYTDPVSGDVVDSSAAGPEVRVRGPFTCGSVDDGPSVAYVLDPGSSGYQYDDRSETHQFNWETSNLAAGCYAVRVYSRLTRQLDGPFLVRLVD